MLLAGRVRAGHHGEPPPLDALVDGDLATTIDFRSVFGGLLGDVLGVDPADVFDHAPRPLPARLTTDSSSRPERGSGAPYDGPMRFVVYGAGAIGGVVGARLAQHGHDVVLIARGAHLDAIRAHGLTLEDPTGSAVLTCRSPGQPAESSAFATDDVVVLAMKSQDTAAAVRDARRRRAAVDAGRVLQNGVENERAALRRFANVYGVCVMCPTAHLDPGVVQAYSAPTTGHPRRRPLPDGRRRHRRATVAAALARRR